MEEGAPCVVQGRPPARPAASAARGLFERAFVMAWHSAIQALPTTTSLLDRYHFEPRSWSGCMVALNHWTDWPTTRVPVLHDAMFRYACARGYKPDEFQKRLGIERLTIDLTFSGGGEGRPAEVSRYHYARRFELLVEHENDPASIYVEAWKLLKIRADLAVLIGYEPRDGHRPRATPIDAVEAQVQAAVDENTGVEPQRLLVILGTSVTQAPWVHWRAYGFDDIGRLIDRAGREIAP